MVGHSLPEYAYRPKSIVFSCLVLSCLVISILLFSFFFFLYSSFLFSSLLSPSLSPHLVSLLFFSSLLLVSCLHFSTFLWRGPAELNRLQRLLHHPVGPPYLFFSFFFFFFRKPRTPDPSWTGQYALTHPPPNPSSFWVNRRRSSCLHYLSSQFLRRH